VKSPRMIPVSSTVKNSRGLDSAALTNALRLRSFRAERDKGRNKRSGLGLSQIEKMICVDLGNTIT
jgi:hypothetical protein